MVVERCALEYRYILTLRDFSTHKSTPVSRLKGQADIQSRSDGHDQQFIGVTQQSAPIK